MTPYNFKNVCDLKAHGIFYDNSTIEIPIAKFIINILNESSDVFTLTYHMNDINVKELRILEVPEGVVQVYCTGHRLEKLILPNSVERLEADKTVKGLEKYIDSIEVIILL